MSAQLSPVQVEFFVAQATSMGIPAREVPELWERHMAYCDANGRDYGGRTWIKFLEPVAKEWRTRVALSKGDAEHAERLSHSRMLARQHTEAEARAYEAEAVSLSTWLESLRAQMADGEALVPLERALAAARPPGPKEDAGAWLMASVADVGAERAWECGTPGCGLPTERWRANNIVYRSGRCVEHGQAEHEAWKQRRRQQQTKEQSHEQH